MVSVDLTGQENCVIIIGEGVESSLAYWQTNSCCWQPFGICSDNWQQPLGPTRAQPAAQNPLQHTNSNSTRDKRVCCSLCCRFEMLAFKCKQPFYVLHMPPPNAAHVFCSFASILILSLCCSACPPIGTAGCQLLVSAPLCWAPGAHCYLRLFQHFSALLSWLSIQLPLPLPLLHGHLLFSDIVLVCFFFYTCSNS